MPDPFGQMQPGGGGVTGFKQAYDLLNSKYQLKIEHELLAESIRGKVIPVDMSNTNIGGKAKLQITVFPEGNAGYGKDSISGMANTSLDPEIGNVMTYPLWAKTEMDHGTYKRKEIVRNQTIQSLNAMKIAENEAILNAIYNNKGTHEVTMGGSQIAAKDIWKLVKTVAKEKGYGRMICMHSYKFFELMEDDRAVNMQFVDRFQLPTDLEASIVRSRTGVTICHSLQWPSDATASPDPIDIVVCLDTKRTLVQAFSSKLEHWYYDKRRTLNGDTCGDAWIQWFGIKMKPLGEDRIAWMDTTISE